MRRTLTLAALAAGGLLAAGASAPAALAADDCPNAAVRAQQMHASNLPNCFAFERITPNNKNGAFVQADAPMLADGSRVAVWSNVALFADDRNAAQQLGTATRGPDGWKIDILSNAPDWGQRRVTISTDGALWRARSEDYRTLLYATNHPLADGDGGGSPAALTNTSDLYLSRPVGPHVWVTAPASGSVPAGTQAGTTPRFWAADPDLKRVVFDTSRVLDPAVDSTSRPHLWLYEDGRPLDVVDRLPDGSVSTATQALSGTSADRQAAVRSSRDARRIVFVSSALHGGQHLYARIDAGLPSARTVLVSANAAGTPCSTAPTFGHITQDGRYVRFRCDAQLTPDAPTSGGMYVRDLDAGTVAYDDPQADRGPVVTYRFGEEWTRPEGTYRVDQSTLVPRQIYRTDLATNVRECVSCPLTGSPTVEPKYGGLPIGLGGGSGVTPEGLVTPDGEVVFVTAQALVPEDTNSFDDVYMWKDGRHFLISTGTAGNHVQFGGVSLDGTTITFSTTSSLVPDDRDGSSRDIYAAVRNGGFLWSGDGDECTSGCQGPAQLPAASTAPLSVGFVDAGNLDEHEETPIAVSGSRSVRGTSLKVKVRIPQAGRVTVSGSGLRATTRTLKRATTATMTVRLSTRAQRTLRRKGTVKVKGTVRFAAAEGPAQSKRVNLTFRQKTKKKQGSSRGVAPAPNGKVAR